MLLIFIIPLTFLFSTNILGPLNPINSPHIAVTKLRTTLLALSIFNFLPDALVEFLTGPFPFLRTIKGHCHSLKLIEEMYSTGSVFL